MKTVLLAMALLVSAFTASFPPFVQAETHVIKFATVAPEGSTWMKHMRDLDNRLRQKTRGQVEFRIYPGGVAGDELDVLRKIRIGQIHSGAFSGAGLGEILPMVRVLDLPFLFRNDEEVDRIHNDLEEHFAARFREKGFELLAWAEVGNVHIFSREPIRSIGDLAKLKVWTWSGDLMARETFSRMGTIPVPLAIADVTTALNTGMIDTVYAPPLGAIALQWHRSMKYMTSLPLAHATGAVLISTRNFEKIPPDLTRILREEFKAAMIRLTRELRDQNQEAAALVEKSGITVLPVPPEPDLKAFYAIHEQVAKALTGKVYPKDLLDRIYLELRKGR